MAVKRYDGSAWQTVAGLGAQGAAATSSSIATWVKTASGGETSLSGNDDSSQALSYTVGQELVFINGTLLKRGSDYTATNGTSITGLTALAANDVATVWTVNAFSVTNAISNNLVTTTGDIIYASGANTPARLGIGSSAQVLTVSGGIPAWATPAGGGKVLQVIAATFSTEVNNTSSTFSDLGLSATITPATSSSRILVMGTLNFMKNASDGSTSGVARIDRAGTNIAQIMSWTGYTNSNLTGPAMIIPYMFLDSPSTTSATIYKIQIASATNGNRVDFNFTGGGAVAPCRIFLVEIGA